MIFVFLMQRDPPGSHRTATAFPYTPRFRSKRGGRLPGCEALQAGLARRLAATLADLGMDVALWVRRIKPHVTIGYDGPPVPAQPVEPVSWTIDRVFLVESLHGRGKHIVHATHPLTTD